MKAEGRELTHFLVSLAVLCLVAAPGNRACPRRCACYVPTEVHCTFRYLTAIPDSIPPNVERINFGYNSLTRLTERDFSGLNQLELLMVHSNGIHTVTSKTFSDLQALQVLKMSYNKVQKIQKDTFYGLRSLTRLHMDHNNIEFINPEAFYGLTFLRLVHLEGNRLTKLHPDTFVSLRYLQIFKMSFIKYLYLSDNLLTSLPKEMISYMPDLESLYLHGNPWTCDCHMKWLSEWMQEKPGVIKCKKDRNPSSPQQCPLCMNPKISKDKLFAVVPASEFLCTKPTVDPSLKSRSMTILEDSGSASISPQDFMAPLGSLILNITDMSGNKANVICSIQKPSQTLPIALSEENEYIMLNMSFSTNLVCHVDSSYIQPVWQVLALYSDSPLTLERNQPLTETPRPSYKYKQVVLKPEDIFTNIEADLQADPSWLMQGQISLQLNRTTTTLTTLRIKFSADTQVTLPRTEIRLVRFKWTMILKTTNIKLEHTVLAGGTIVLDCPGQGDPTPYLEWLLADGSKVRAPYVSEDGRILIDKSGQLELQMADGFDTGIYHCISTNYDDADTLTYRITVVEPHVEDTRENGILQTVFAGETLDLPCQSSGIPDASISWVLPGNAMLSQSSRDKHLLSNGTLRILQVTPKDQGPYRCVAANPFGVEFLMFHVSVKTKDQRSEEYDGKTEGSGLEQPDPSTHFSSRRPPTLASTWAEVGKGSKGSQQDSHRRFPQQRRRDPAKRPRFREHRRPFPPSARRIDPQHWATLLEKAKKNALLEKQESTTRGPLLQVTPPVKTPGEEEHASGTSPLDGEFMVLGTKASSVSARSVAANTVTVPHGLVTNVTSDPELSPITSPQILRSPPLTDLKLSNVINTAAMPKDINPTISSKLDGTTNENSVPTFALMPGITRFQNSGQVGSQRAPFQSTDPETWRTLVTDSHTTKLRVATNKADIVIQSANPTEHQQTPLTMVGIAQRSHLHLRATQEHGKLPSELYTTAPSAFQSPTNNTATFPLARRFGRQRKIWSRGRIISPYRTPVLRRHRYGIVRPDPSSPANRSMSSAIVPHELCPPSCPPTERLTPALSVPGSFPSLLPKVEEPTTPFHSPSSLFEHGKKVNFEKTTDTIEHFSLERTQMTLTRAIVTSAPTAVPLEKTLPANADYPGVSSNGKMRDSAMTSPFLGLLTTPSVPTKTGTRASRKKIPWHQLFANNHNQKGILKNMHKFGLQKSTATLLPKVPPSLPRDKVSPSHPTTFSASGLQILSATIATTHYNATKTRSVGNHPAGKRFPLPPTFPPFYPMLPSTTSNRSSPLSAMSVGTITLATPTGPTSVVIPKTQTARPKSGEGQRLKAPQENSSNPNTTPGQNSGFVTPPDLAPAANTSDTAIDLNVSVFMNVSLQDPSRIGSTTGLHTGTLSLTGVTAELLQDSTQTLKTSPTAAETSLFSTVEESITTKKTSGMPPSLGSGIPLVPTLAAPDFIQHAETDDTAMPHSEMVTSTVVTMHGPSRYHTDPQSSAAEAVASPETRPNPELTTAALHFTYFNLFPSTPLPTQRLVEPQNSKWKASAWPENQFQHKLHSEIAEKDQRSEVGMTPPLHSTEPIPRAAHWGGQKNTKSGFDKKPAQKTTSKLLSSNSLSKIILIKPSIVGGKAASFTVPADSEAFLPCEAVGNPVPSIRWTRVSSGLELSGRSQESRFQVLPNGTLAIQKVSVQDRGQYLCSASNSLGTDHLHVTLSVVTYPPRILERHTQEIMVRSGSTVELKCRVEGRPSPTVSWILANQTVVSETSEGKRKKVLVTPDGTLVIHNVNIHDHGFYKCIASNSAGQDSLLVRIQVIVAPPVIVEQKRQVLIGMRGESLNLPCTAIGTPQPHVHWVLSDGTEVKPLQLDHPKLLLYANGTLKIRNIAPSDRGTYECIATSSSGSERRVVILIVEEPETIPRIEVASQKWTEVNLGDKLLLNCSATGNPEPKIIWRLPSKVVIDQWHRMGSRVHVYPNGSLFIGSMTEKDGGDYLCVARNKMGDDLMLMRVGLRVAPPSGRLTPAKIDPKQHFKKQVFHGKDFQVDCKASGSPAPEISWSLPDGTVINNAIQAEGSGRRTKRYTLFHNGTLYFDKVGVAEEGDYTCHAQNTLGKDEMKVHLTVVTAAPRIRQGYRTNVRFKVGDTAVLDCEVIGEPKPKVFWLLPSRDTVSFSDDKHTLHANGSLSIHKVRLLDSGKYICVARNPSGDDTKTYQLDIVSKPPLINGLYTNKAVIKTTAVRHSKKHFDCRAEGKPPPQITWLMPDNILLTAPYYGSRVTVHINGTLEIRNVRLSDSNDFICVARNEGGESRLVVQLEVLEMLRRPTFRNPFNEKVVALLGKPATLNCSVDGNPPPEIIWILPNGTQFSNGPQNLLYRLASNGSLIIYKLTRNTTGKYRCAARNIVGYIEKLILLEIGQKPVILTYALGVIKSTSGESLALQCMSDGIPKPNVKWTTPNGEVIDRPQVNGKYTLYENGTLVIKEATAYDRGNYICKAQNSVGQALITVPVMIVAYPPRIINRLPRSVLTRAGVRIQLYCAALGIPKPEITWEMPDQALVSKASQGKSHRSEIFHPRGALIIQNPQVSDSGTYKCTAKNSLGTDYTTTYIQVT